MTNAEKFEQIFGAKPNIIHCPILNRKDCGRCKGFEGNSPCCDSDWWNSEYKPLTEIVRDYNCTDWIP